MTDKQRHWLDRLRDIAEAEGTEIIPGKVGRALIERRPFLRHWMDLGPVDGFFEGGTWGALIVGTFASCLDGLCLDEKEAAARMNEVIDAAEEDLGFER